VRTRSVAGFRHAFNNVIHNDEVVIVAYAMSVADPITGRTDSTAERPGATGSDRRRIHHRAARFGLDPTVSRRAALGCVRRPDRCQAYRFGG
jgi:hypothetical protein